MAEPNTHNHYTLADIDRYLAGQMTTTEMHDMERAALQDPFLADAIEGYRDADRSLAGTHLNEIAAAIQNKPHQTKVIPLTKKKNYAWQIAASVVVLVSAGLVFFTNKQDVSNQASLASNNIKKEEKQDTTGVERSKPSATLSQDSSLLTLQNPEALASKKNIEANDEKSIAKKTKPAADVTASSLPNEERETPVAMAPAPASSRAFTDNAVVARRLSLPITADTEMNNSLAETIVTSNVLRKAKAATNTWTTDKGKPFILSEVEVINIGQKTKKQADTTVIKPVGGWQSFQEYLFSKLSRKDTLSFINNTLIDGNLELEFSFDNEGSPYDIRVLHAQDSTTVNTIISAMQEGPKWISADKKEKRLNLKY